MIRQPFRPIIIIPVFNGRSFLIQLMDRIRKLSQHTIMIIDDGSTDGLNKQELGDVVYVKHVYNKGKGAALKTGLNHAKSLGFTHALSIDADGQHDPGMLHIILKMATEHSRALIVGRRDFTDNNMPVHRMFSNNLTSLILSLRTGVLIRDSQVGYRCYPLKDRRLWEILEDGFQFESAVFLRAAKLKLPLIWQTIPVIYNQRSSHMNLTLDTIRFIRTFFRSFNC